MKREGIPIDGWKRIVFIVFCFGILCCYPVNCIRTIHLDESLYGAAQKGKVKEMEYWLSQGADPNGKFDGSEPILTAAVSADCIPCVQLLRDRGADITAMGKDGNTWTSIPSPKMTRYIQEWRKEEAQRASKL